MAFAAANSLVYVSDCSGAFPPIIPLVCHCVWFLWLCFRQFPAAAERSGGLAMICLRGTMIPPLDSDPELDFQPFGNS